MATKKETADAIARVKASPSESSKKDNAITERAAKQAGSAGNRAREALGRK